MKTIKKSGEWELKEFTVTQEDEIKQKETFFYIKSGRHVPAGSYLQLKRGDTVVMSNTPDELIDFSYFIEECAALTEITRREINVLIAGLGMGCVVDELLKNELVNITVIEKSSDVIKITASKYNDCKNVSIIHDDIFELDIKSLPAAHYDIAWFDIWDYICASNIDEFKKLRRKYSRRVKFKRFWAEYTCQKMHNSYMKAHI